MAGLGVSSLCYSVTDLNFAYQFVPQQPIRKAMRYRLKSDTDKVNKHVYGSMNENEKMLLKTQKRLEQKSCCKRNLKRKQSLMSHVKAMLDVYIGVTKKKDEDTGTAYSKLQENSILTSSHRFRINASILVRPYGNRYKTEEENENFSRFAYQVKTQQPILTD